MTYDYTKGNILKNIFSFSLPFFLSYFLQTLYGLADLFIVGQYNGAEVIAAVAVGSQIMHMVTVVIVGLAMGSSVMISRCVGASDFKSASKIVCNTVLLFLGVAVVLTAGLLLCSSLIVCVMAVPVESIEETKRYLNICFLGIPFVVAYNVLGSVFRGMGDTKSPLVFIAIACAVNVVLDFLLVGVFGMGASGAAWATVAAQAVSVGIAFLVIKKNGFGIKIKKSDFDFDVSLQSKLLGIGLPIAVQDAFVQVSFLLITMIVNKKGVSVAAAVGIVEKIICFLFLVPSTMLSAVSALSAQNIGAGEFGRAKRILFDGCSIAVAFGLFFALVFQFISVPFLSLFTQDSDVVELGSQYLRTYVFDCVFAGIHFPFSGFFSAHGRSSLSFIHNVFSIICVRIPGAYLAAVFFPKTLYALGVAAPGGSLLSVMICIGLYVVLSRRGKFDCVKV